MNVATAPSTPENAKSPPIFRRAFTVPTRFSSLSKATVPLREAEVQGAETLFAHEYCRIVSFSTGFRRPSSSGGGYNGNLEEDPVGTLPWASLTERTIAAGPLRIYRVLEVCFLNSGSTLRPILAKSQCWCVDGESKFVLKVAPDSFYRIELPNTCPEENEKVEKLKGVLAKVLQYETTQCPFKRGFTVDLPKPPATPVRKRPWRPKRPSQPSLEPPVELDVDSSGEEYRQSRGMDATLADCGTDKGESSQGESADEASVSSNTSSAVAQEDADSSTVQDTEDILPALAPDLAELDLMKTPTRPKSLKAGRAITAPPQLTLRTTPPSNSTSNIPMPQKREKESPSISSSTDSFHSFHSPISPLPPSPPYSDPPSFSLLAGEKDDTIKVERVRSHKRDISDSTLTTDTPRDWIMTPTPTSHDAPPTPQTPTLINDDASSQNSSPNLDPVTPSPQTQLRHRRRGATSKQQRATSPLPPPANLYSPRSSRLSGHHLTTAILQKTCSLLLGPPIQLVALMLNIARKIAQGSYCGFAFGHGEQGQRIPCSWDFGSEDNVSEVDGRGKGDRDGEGEEQGGGWYEEEDDYGVNLRSTTSLGGSGGEGKVVRKEVVGGSWEID